MTKKEISSWLTMHKHFNDWFRKEEWQFILNVLQLFHTETAQRIVLKSIADISPSEDKDQIKVRDRILSQVDFKQPFDDAAKNLKELKTKENNQKQIKIAQKLADEINLLNKINLLPFERCELDGIDRKRIYNQLKQLSRDQQTILLTKIREREENYKITYIKTLFENVRFIFCFLVPLLISFNTIYEFLSNREYLTTIPLFLNDEYISVNWLNRSNLDNLINLKSNKSVFFCILMQIIYKNFCKYLKMVML